MKYSILIFCFLAFAKFHMHAQAETVVEPVKELTDKEKLKAERKKQRVLKRASKTANKQRSTSSSETNSGRDWREMNEAFSNQGYMSSAKYYRSLSTSEKNNITNMVRMANAYRLNNKTIEAESLYARFINKVDDPEQYLHYANVLQQNNKCEDAVRWFKRYAAAKEMSSDQKMNLLSSCDEIEKIKTHDNISINNMTQINTKDLDFSPIPYGDGMVFTSTRENGGVWKSKDCWTEGGFSNLYYAKGNQCNFNDAKPLKGKINNKFHDGTPSFTDGGYTMFFTRNNSNGADKEGTIHLKIYKSTNFENYWSDVEEWEHNSDNYSSCHPSLSSDGLKMYFSSNRPGGMGGMDIYVSEFVNGAWQAPQNLGPTVNSMGNEVFPYVDKEGSLYYSSNGFVGVGGLDLYVATKRDVTDETSWSRRYNLGKPINSPKDDFGFYINEQGTSGFLTSDREGGLGGDDIYCWSEPLPLNVIPDYKPGQVCVYEEGNNEEINDVAIRIIENYGGGGTQTFDNANELTSLNTDAAGLAGFEVNRKSKYKIKIEKEGYIAREMEVDGEEWYGKEKYCFAMTKVPPPPPPVVVAEKPVVVVPARPSCNCSVTSNVAFGISTTTAPKVLTRLGSNPEFGNSHGLSPEQFFEKIKVRYYTNEVDQKFLDRIFVSMGYDNGFEDAESWMFSNAEVASGTVGTMGYSKYHKSLFAILSPKSNMDLKAFRIQSANGCDMHFMKTCGNHFFFCDGE